MANVVVLGSANIDYVIQVQKLPAPGQTVMGNDLVTTFGGKGANAATAAARLGGKVQLIGTVGTDSAGNEYLEHLRQEHIDVQWMRRAEQRPTGSALILVDENGSNMIAVAPGANGAVSLPDIEAAAPAIRAASVLLCQFEVPLDSVQAAVRIANQARVPVILNPSPMRLDFPWDSVQIDYLVVNEGEATMLDGRSDSGSPEECAARLNSRGFRNVIVTCGSDPTVATNEGGSQAIGTFPVEPVDTVGAGDTFAGALAVGIAEARDLHDAIRFANAAAALSTTRMGAQTSMPQRTEVDRLIR